MANRRSAAQRRQQANKQRQTQKRPVQQQQQRRRVQHKSNRRPWILVAGVMVIVAVIVVIFYVLSRQNAGTSSKPTPVSSSVLKEVTQVNPAILAAVGTGGIQNTPHAAHGQPLLKGPDGKPEFFYMGAEWCPYCAAQRWGMVVALSRFGTFSHLSQITSSSSDVYPNTPTFTFYGSTYSSSYIDFVALETQTNQQDSSGNYPVLETPTAQEQQLVSKYDAPPYVSSGSQGSIPFIDIANQYIVSGASYSPQVLSGLSAQQIASDLSNQSSPVAQGILGTANYLTAAICMTTNQQPASVCKTAPIPSVEQLLNKSAFVGSPGLAADLIPNSFEAIVPQRNVWQKLA